jgi:hypothetical protein
MEGSLTDQKALNNALGLGDSEDPLRNVSGKLILTNLSDIDSLELGNGTYADMAY